MRDDQPHRDLLAALEREQEARTAPACPDCARLERELAAVRRERDELDRKAERHRREAEQAGGQLWAMECEIQDLKLDLAQARVSG